MDVDLPAPALRSSTGAGACRRTVSCFQSWPSHPPGSGCAFERLRAPPLALEACAVLASVGAWETLTEATTSGPVEPAAGGGSLSGEAGSGVALVTTDVLATLTAFITGSLGAGTVCDSLAVADAFAVCAGGAPGFRTLFGGAAFEAVVAAARVAGAAATARAVVVRFAALLPTGPVAGVDLRVATIPA